jgi:hypothetical protein
MPRPRTGSTFQTSGKWFARVTLKAGDRPALSLPTCTTEAAATKRAALLNVTPRPPAS